MGRFPYGSQRLLTSSTAAIRLVSSADGSVASLDLGADYPNPLTDDVLAAADVVVSMDCGDACAIYPGKRYLDRTLDDPQGSNSRDGPLHPRRLGHQGPTLLRELTTPVPACPHLLPVPPDEGISLHVHHPQRVLRLRVQRRTLADGRRFPLAPR